MNTYLQKLIKQAEEIYSLQLEASKKIPKEFPCSDLKIKINSKIQHLIGYILALREIKIKE